MSQTETQLPRRIERKITNRGNSRWYQYKGENLFDAKALDRLRDRFVQMNEHDWEKLFTVKGAGGPRTKIRTKDLDDFRNAVRDAEIVWKEEYGRPLTAFGNPMYGEPVGELNVVEIAEENPRKTVVQANYNTGHRAFIGGEGGKKQTILLPVRAFEQWLYHTEVVEPIFDRFHEKYPY